MSASRFLFASLLLLIWIVAGGFATQANVFLSGYRDKDPQMKQAYRLTFWVAFITWFLIGVAIIIICVMFFTGAGEAEVAEGEASAEESELSGKNKNSFLTNIFFLVSFILVLITGFLSMFAAVNIKNSANYNSTVSRLRTAYKNCIISASLSLGTVGILIIGYIAYIANKNKKKQLKTKKEKAVLSPPPSRPASPPRSVSRSASPSRPASLPRSVFPSRNSSYGSPYYSASRNSYPSRSTPSTYRSMPQMRSY